MLLLAKATTFLLLLLSSFTMTASAYALEAQENDLVSVINENSGITTLVVGAFVILSVIITIYSSGEKRGRESGKLDKVEKDVGTLTIKTNDLTTTVGTLTIKADDLTIKTNDLTTTVGTLTIKTNDLATTVGNLTIKVNDLTTTVGNLTTKVNDLATEVVVIKTEVGSINSTLKSIIPSIDFSTVSKASPYYINEAGQKAAREIDAEKIFNNHWDYLRSCIEATGATLPYDIQEASIIASIDLDEVLTDEEKRVIKESAYTAGMRYESILLLFAVMARDKLLKERESL